MGLFDIVDDLVGEATRHINERLEYELRGAYRAGYEYLYVGHHRTRPFYPILVFPANVEWAPRVLHDDAEMFRWEVYHLSDLDPAEYREAVGTLPSGTTR